MERLVVKERLRLGPRNFPLNQNLIFMDITIITHRFSNAPATQSCAILR